VEPVLSMVRQSANEKSGLGEAERLPLICPNSCLTPAVKSSSCDGARYVIWCLCFQLPSSSDPPLSPQPFLARRSASEFLVCPPSSPYPNRNAAVNRIANNNSRR